MPDDTDPDDTADADAAGGGPGGGHPEPLPGEATQAVPFGEATQAVPADASGARGPAGEATRAVPVGATPPTGTAAAAPAAAAGAGAGPAAGAAAPAAPSGGDAGRASSTNRALLIGLVAAAVLLAAAGIALAVSGGNNHPKAAGSGSTGPTPTTQPGPPCPLTGTPSSGNEVPQRPALAVKVDNYPQARPQSGLDKADIVFEEPVEGGITRLVAVFQCQSPSLVGPIRSARAVDVPILDQLSQPVFIHVGGIDPVISLLRAGNLNDENLFTHGSIVQTLAGRQAPYDTYISAAAGWGLDPSDTTPPAALFTYAATAPPGTPVSTVHIPFASTNDTLWTWNAASGQWLLSYRGTNATVAGGGQIATSNIVIQTVHVTYGPWLENDVGGLEVQSQLIGSGPLTVLRDGVAVTGTWRRASSSDPTTLTAADGSTIALRPGPTWVEIVPSAIPVTTTSPGATTTTTHR